MRQAVTPVRDYISSGAAAPSAPLSESAGRRISLLYCPFGILLPHYSAGKEGHRSPVFLLLDHLNNNEINPER